jgi:hypothetical protein
MKRAKETKTIFYRWLEKNLARFQYKPIVNGDDSFTFLGITSAITLHIEFSQPEVMLSFDDVETKENYDIFSIQYIGKYSYDAKLGHYDADRVDKIYTYHESYEQLIVNEVFEEIVHFTNRYFNVNNALYLLKTKGYTEAFIASKDENFVDNSSIYSRKLQKIMMKNIPYKKIPLTLQTAQGEKRC